MELSVHSDTTLAIGTAKELIETCCKTILAERGKTLHGKRHSRTHKIHPQGIEDCAGQLNSVWRVMAFFQWAMGRPLKWGVMARNTTWQIR
jgi:hypothetical protein